MGFSKKVLACGLMILSMLLCSCTDIRQTIVLIGDSTTSPWCEATTPAPCNVAHFIHQYFDTPNRPFVEVINVGAGGSRAKDWVPGAPPYTFLGVEFGVMFDNIPTRADYVVVQIGTNDATAGTPPAVFEQQLLAIMNAKPSTKFLFSIVTIPPKFVGTIRGDRLAALNAVMAGVATEPVIDAQIPQEMYLPDGVHPTVEGYGHLGNASAVVIEGYLP